MGGGFSLQGRLGRIVTFARDNFFGVIISGVVIGVAGNFAYDLLKGDGGTASPALPRTSTPPRSDTSTTRAAVQEPTPARQPRRIAGDPASVVFFDPASGKPLVWYHVDAGDSYELFDGPGFYSGTGKALIAVTPELVEQINARAHADRAAAAEAQRNKAEAERRAALARLFGVSAYPNGVTLVGVQPQSLSAISQDATRILMARLLGELGGTHVVAEAPKTIYQSDIFGQLMKGSFQDIRDSGLDAKLRAAVFATVEATCRDTTAIADAVTCTIDARIRGIDADLKARVFEDWTATGAGANDREALSRSVDRLFEQNSRKLKAL
jgi:hypothetical protein